MCHLCSHEATWRGEELAPLNGRFGPIKLEVEQIYTDSHIHAHACTHAAAVPAKAWPGSTPRVHSPAFSNTQSHVSLLVHISEALKQVLSCLLSIRADRMKTHPLQSVFCYPRTHINIYTAALLSLRSHTVSHTCTSTAEHL